MDGSLPDLKEDYQKDAFKDPSSATAGAGLVNDITVTAQSMADGNSAGTTMGLMSTAFDALSFAADPLQGLLSAGIGWLIEHVSFLREPLDKLAGDPGAIQAEADTWKNIETELGKIKGDYENAMKTEIASWKDRVGDAYRNHGNGLAQELQGYSAGAHGASEALKYGGILVGIERGIIREMITTFIAKMIERAAIALAASFFTFGGAAAVFAADAAIEGTILAGKIASKISKLLQKLAQLMTKLKKLGGQLGQLAAKGAQAAGKGSQAAKTVAQNAGKTAAKHYDAPVNLAGQVGKVSGKIDDFAAGRPVQPTAGQALKDTARTKFSPKDKDGNPQIPNVVHTVRGQVQAGEQREESYEDKHPEYKND
ncbi:hypothetical protein EV193_105142 [Herbihabitans rhizosphaerae]|uniref:WXG100 family type VII secretion target n=1 Tax=Herbihabitans rhizosphaerae TaxID=1872711 RepID=A0A4Q7KMN3_9PSEU|nr:hypothetical protein [Herbihabitans rhizosphaerae]RZS37584.1 hypothetical protein EV193_105142 [Herbihabitans rhizosphaerae]